MGWPVSSRVLAIDGPGGADPLHPTFPSRVKLRDRAVNVSVAWERSSRACDLNRTPRLPSGRSAHV